jgi:nitrous oxide reductase accessory protein NosL
MDRCSRWFHSADAVAYEITASSGLPNIDGVGPHVPRIWETCPVCGRFVAPHPDWIAQIVYDDGVTLFFDGAKDLFRFLLSPQRSCSDPELVPIGGIFVTSFYDRAVIDARSSFFVIGSDVLGPGGGELVAHESVGEAWEFSRGHHGRRVLGFETVTADLLDSTLGGEA